MSDMMPIGENSSRRNWSGAITATACLAVPLSCGSVYTTRAKPRRLVRDWRRASSLVRSSWADGKATGGGAGWGGRRTAQPPRQAEKMRMKAEAKVRSPESGVGQTSNSFYLAIVPVTDKRTAHIIPQSAFHLPRGVSDFFVARLAVAAESVDLSA